MSPYREMEMRALAAEAMICVISELNRKLQLALDNLVPEIQEAAACTKDLEDDCIRLRKMVTGCDCKDPSQCWEPCGTLGHHARFAKVVEE